MNPEFVNYIALEILLGLPTDCLVLISIEIFWVYLTFRKYRPFSKEDNEYPIKTKNRQTRTATVNDNAMVKTSEFNLLLVESFIALEERR